MLLASFVRGPAVVLFCAWLAWRSGAGCLTLATAIPADLQSARATLDLTPEQRVERFFGPSLSHLYFWLRAHLPHRAVLLISLRSLPENDPNLLRFFEATQNLVYPTRLHFFQDRQDIARFWNDHTRRCTYYLQWLPTDPHVQADAWELKSTNAPFSLWQVTELGP